MESQAGAMVLIGAFALALAVFAFFSMRKMRHELHAMIGAETLPVNQLEELRTVSDEVAGNGLFRKQCEVVGAAHPNPRGPLTSELGEAECVWYRYQVLRHYEHVEYRDGKRRVRRRKEQVAGHTSHQGYALRDDQGTLIGVDPNGTQPDRPEKVVDRFEQPRSQQGPSLFGIQLPNVFREGTIGYEYSEWVLRPGQRLYVLGEVHDRIGPLVIGNPEQDGHFIISTRSEAEIRRDRKQKHQKLRIAVLVLAPVGLVLLLTGAVVALT